MKSKTLLRFVAVFLTVCILTLSFASCSFSVNGERAQSAEVEEARTPYADLGDDFLIGDETLSYQYKRSDEEKLRDTLSEMNEVLDTGINGRRLQRLYELFDEQCSYLSRQCMLAEVEYYLFLEDEEVKENFLYINALYTEMEKSLALFHKAVYDSALRDVFFGDWSQSEIDEMLVEAQRYEGAYADLLKASDEMLVEYRNCLSVGDYWGICDVYLEFAENNNEIASHFGYENYMDYAYPAVFSRDYDVEEGLLAVEYIKNEIAPLILPLLQKYYIDVQTISESDYISLVTLINGHDITNEDDLALLKAFYDGIDTHAVELLEELLAEGNYFVSGNEASYDGAFTTMLSGSDRALVYFGPNYRALLTGVHEFGHYMADCLSTAPSLNYDMAEVQSQGGEMLFLRYLESLVSPAVARLYAEYTLIDSLLMTVIAACVNEFEIFVYENIDTLTAEDLTPAFSALINEALDMNALSGYVNDLSYYWLYVVVESPAYYISYSVSQLAAFMIYAMAGDDYEGTCALYYSLLGVDTDGFCSELEEAGLYTPFDEQLYALITYCFTEDFALTVEP